MPQHETTDSFLHIMVFCFVKICYNNENNATCMVAKVAWRPAKRRGHTAPGRGCAGCFVKRSGENAKAESKTGGALGGGRHLRCCSRGQRACQHFAHQRGDHRAGFRCLPQPVHAGGADLFHMGGHLPAACAALSVSVWGTAARKK
ncbi:hypothetical protein SDC9_131506 [bioreactor metagenome]|uniref:Uncharacterized protein n=1 Tax=bioreactor metagenome TaxID=1076179 RepID=A0A645D539_9ZZZZ